MNNQRGIKDQILNEMKVLRIIAFIVMAISLLSSLRKGINLDNLMEEHKLIYCCLGLISISFTPDFLLPDAIENLFFRKNNRIERGGIIKKISHISFLFFTIVFVFSHFNNKFTIFLFFMFSSGISVQSLQRIASFSVLSINFSKDLFIFS